MSTPLDRNIRYTREELTQSLATVEEDLETLTHTHDSLMRSPFAPDPMDDGIALKIASLTESRDWLRHVLGQQDVPTREH